MEDSKKSYNQIILYGWLDLQITKNKQIANDRKTGTLWNQSIDSRIKLSCIDWKGFQEMQDE